MTSLWRLGTCPFEQHKWSELRQPRQSHYTAPDFFKNGGIYWFSDGNPNPGHSSFTGRDAVTCTIYAGTSKSSKLKRDDDEIGAVGLVVREAVDSEVLEVRSHAAHKARAHARGLRNFVGAHKA